MSGDATVIYGARCCLRGYRLDDVEQLATIARDFEVARWLTARFPHPYTLEAAQSWIAKTAVESPIDNFAIEVGGALAGSVGLVRHGGEQLGVAEFGYWLGRRFWGRGIATEAAQLLATHAFAQRAIRRLEAHVFAPNRASTRVLEKVGFIREAVMRAALTDRSGDILDAYLYARLRANHR